MSEPSTRESTAPPGIEARLLHAAPLTAREVLYAGDGLEAFAAAYRLRNPKATVRGAPNSTEALFDLVVAGPGAKLAEVLQRPILRPGGALTLAGPAGAADPPAELAAAGFAVVKTRPGDGGPVWVAQRAADAALPKVHVELFAFARRLMDIRTRLPMAQLDTEADITANMQTPPFTLSRGPADGPKIVISQRPGAYTLSETVGFLAPALAAGWVPVLEVDDHPDLYLRLMDDPDHEKAWTMIRAMAAVQTSTPALAEAFRVHNPEVRVFPNAAFELPPFPEGDRPRRVFYGAVTRGPLAVDVARSLAPVVRQFPDTEFLVVGDRDVFDALPTRRKRFEDYLPYERYLALMRTCSVTLSPLADGAPERAKSDAKFLDAAQSGALLIASPVVYGEVVRHGVNGLIARSRDQWAPLLSGALRNQAKRREMARRAWQEVRESRMFADQIAERRDWYLDLWNRRADLERALCERIPELAEAIRKCRGQG